MPFFNTEDGIKLYYEIFGKGEPIILIHGLTANHGHFKYQVEELKKDFQVIVYDLRGHGKSEVSDHNLNLKRMALDLRNFLEHLELSSASMAGWSLGTHVIFEYIKQFGQETIKRFCIIDMTPKLLKSGDWNLGLRGSSGKYGDYDYQDNTRTMAAYANSDWELIAKGIVEALGDISLKGTSIFENTSLFKGKEDIEWLYKQALQNRHSVIISLWASMSVQDYRSLLETIDIPVLITYGEGSRCYSADNSHYMHKKLKNSVVVPFPGCGHGLHMQDYEMFNKVFKEFMQQDDCSD